jgi:hypothetical protein
VRNVIGRGVFLSSLVLHLLHDADPNQKDEEYPNNKDKLPFVVVVIIDSSSDGGRHLDDTEKTMGQRH